MKKIIFLFLIFYITYFSSQEKIFFWPKDEIPNSKITHSKSTKKNKKNKFKEPELFAFLPPIKERTKMAVIIIPGGGYSKLTYDEGAFQIAKWMNTQGISAFVLNYRLPISENLIQREIAPLQDIQAAIKYIRKNASTWDISPNLLGVVGTSAGGHLAAMVSNISTDYTKLKGDWQNYSTLPNFAVLFCPVIDLGEFAHKGSRNSLLGENATLDKIKEYSMQHRVTLKTPPTLLFHNQDDSAVSPMNSILYYKEMNKYNVKGSLFIFPKGGHRFFVTDKDSLNENWKKLCADWLSSIINQQ